VIEHVTQSRALVAVKSGRSRLRCLVPNLREPSTPPPEGFRSRTIARSADNERKGEISMRMRQMETAIAWCCLAPVARTLLEPRAAYRANKEAFIKSKMCLLGTLAACWRFSLCPLSHTPLARSRRRSLDLARSQHGSGHHRRSSAKRDRSSFQRFQRHSAHDADHRRRCVCRTRTGPRDRLQHQSYVPGVRQLGSQRFPDPGRPGGGLYHTLQISSVSATVEVAAAPLVEDTKTDVSQVVTSQQILDLRSTAAVWTRSHC